LTSPDSDTALEKQAPLKIQIVMKLCGLRPHCLAFTLSIIVCKAVPDGHVTYMDGVAMLQVQQSVGPAMHRSELRRRRRTESVPKDVTNFANPLNHEKVSMANSSVQSKPLSRAHSLTNHAEPNHSVVRVHRLSNLGLLSANDSVVVEKGPFQGDTGMRVIRTNLGPFSYLGTELILELHVPGLTLHELHHTVHKSLSDFLLNLHKAISKASSVSMNRIKILSIYGRYRASENAGMISIGAPAKNPMRTEDEIVVRFEVLPAQEKQDEPDPPAVLDVLRQKLQASDPIFVGGKLGNILQNSTITLSLSSGLARITQAHEKSKNQVSTMALPIGISAAFTGILVWIAAS